MSKVQSSVLFLALVAGIIPADAQTYTVLYNFGTSSAATGLSASLVEDNAGNFYSVGASANVLVIFKLAPPGTVTILHSFTAAESTSFIGMTLGTDGNLYGVTANGGTASANCPASNGYPGGCGTIFKFTPGGTYSVLYNFDQTHGSSPNPLILGSDGNFYGTTTIGGSTNCDLGCGVIFKITAQGNYSVLHYFDVPGGTAAGPASGYAAGPLIQANDGSLYGTTGAGGTNNTGTIFNITTAGQFTVLYNFGANVSSNDEPLPSSYPLAQGKDGNFYGLMIPSANSVYCDQGTCYCFAVCGAVFKITPQGSFSVLYDFPANTADISQGALPYSLAQGIGDNFFGLARGGTGCPAAEYGCGIIFQVTSSGAYSIVYNFDGTHGANAIAAPIQGIDGNYYGTTTEGGTGSCQAGCGVLYAMVVNDFSLAESTFKPETISPGASSTSAVNVAAVGGFSTKVALACSVRPAPALAPKCSVSSSSVSPGTAATLTVSTTAPTMAGLPRSRFRPFYGFWLALVGLAVAVVDLGSDRSEKHRMTGLLLLGAVLLSLILTVACGGSSTMSNGSTGTPAGTYKITVTGTSGFLEHSTTTTLTVH